MSSDPQAAQLVYRSWASGRQNTGYQHRNQLGASHHQPPQIANFIWKILPSDTCPNAARSISKLFHCPPVTSSTMPASPVSGLTKKNFTAPEARTTINVHTLLGRDVRGVQFHTLIVQVGHVSPRPPTDGTPSQRSRTGPSQGCVRQNTTQRVTVPGGAT